MQKPAATLDETNMPQDPSLRPPIKPYEKRAPVLKFTYASGARPLDGYTIKRGIGIGGFGEVYFAISDAGKEVALKRVQRNLDVEVRGVTQCLNLKHHNLISLYDIRYDADGEAWVVMEYVTGESLKDVIERHANGMPKADAERWFESIASGVTYLHDHGIVHRDLKPGNIFVDDTTIKIGDYGLSKFISCSRRSGQTESVGTFHYMAPEIGKGIYGKEIDIYALGIILHEMLTGRVPFDGESSQEIIMKHLTADPDLGGLSEPHKSVIRKALSKDPAHRFASVPEMVKALRDGVMPSSSSATSELHFVSDEPPVISTKRSEPFYIGDDASEEPGIVFGPVHEGTGPRVPPKVAPAVAVAPTGKRGEEPIARAVRHGWSRFNTSFENTPYGAVLKIAILITVAMLMIINVEVFLPLGILLGTLYLIYYGLRTLVTGEPSGLEHMKVLRQKQQETARAQCRAKSFRMRIAELSGSMLGAAGCIIPLSALVAVAAQQPTNISLDFWLLYGWMTLTAIAASWLMLITGKWWERAEGQSFARRMTMIGMGLVLGVASFGLSYALNLNLQDVITVREMPRPIQMPALPAFMIYFAGLMALPRWWRLVDPLRKHRVSLLSAAFAGFWAYILHLLLAFPLPLGVLLALIISLAVQLSAPWMDWKRLAPARAAA